MTEIEQYVRGYRLTPQTTEDEWGNLTESGDRSGLETSKRLEAEEAAVGLDW